MHALRNGALEFEGLGSCVEDEEAAKQGADCREHVSLALAILRISRTGELMQRHVVTGRKNAKVLQGADDDVSFVFALRRTAAKHHGKQITDPKVRNCIASAMKYVATIGST